MNQTEPSSLPGPKPLFQLGWTTALSILGVIAAVGAVTLHIVGLTQHQVYLGFWGLNANLFPKSTDWLLLQGYYGLFERLVAVIRATMGNIGWLFLTVLFLGLLVFLVNLVNRIELPELPSRFIQLAKWQRELVLVLLLAMCFCAALPGTLLVFVAFSAGPAALGETAGRSAAEAALIEYKKGCAESRPHCVQLKRTGENVAKGYVLDDSQSHIAIFDVELQRGRTLPREGLEVVAVREPGLKPNGK